MNLFLNHKSHLILLFLLALSLRLCGLNWDQGQHLHPDERFLTMVTADIKLPTNVLEYFDTDTSPLNPHNHPNYQFFVYGTFPLFLTKVLAVILGLDTYDSIHLVGRVLSALFDSLNIFLLYFLSRKIKIKNPFLPSLLYALTALPLQLSHFFAVDTFLSFFILLTFIFLAYDKFVLASITFGLSLACKISAIYFAPIILLFLIFHYFRTKNFIRILSLSFLLLLTSFTAFRLFQPYAFNGPISLDPNFLANLKTLQSFSNPDGWFPPSVQWLSKIRFLFPLQNIILWGAGLGFFLIFILSISYHLLAKKNQSNLISLSLIWVLFLFLLQGSQFAHSMRYFLPIYPFLCLLASLKSPPKILFFLHLIYGLFFLSIYTRPHSRVQASNWIYQQLPAGSRITNESWDDPLPLYLSPRHPNIYQSITLPLYDPDTPEKWQNINPILDNTDYIIMSSNRLWGSIPKVSIKYPISSKFYQDLFNENLNFKKLIEVNSYPGLNLPFLSGCYYFGPTDYPGLKPSWFDIDSNCSYPGIYLRDDIAEEAFSVYDHPKVLIFARK